jgi:23S rRNA (cytosine1962-C5)-methyltransferase
MFGYLYSQLVILHSPLPHYPHIRIRHKEELRLLGGHLWAFSNELLDLPKDIEAGTIVTLVRERDGSPIGNGFFHPNSLIAFRLLSRDASAEVDDGFFERRISKAANRRTLLRTRRNALRLVHGESDLLPGLIVDQYDRVLSYQIVSAGFERRKDLIVDILQKLFQPSAIVAKNNSHLRKLEGLPLGESLVFGSDAKTEFHDAAGSHYQADVLAGQKTGFYLDQMENRTRLRDFIRPGARVLDLFANDGGFSINAALAGAESVVAVDESASALERLAHNVELNGVQNKIETVTSDCFNYVREARGEFDVIVLDPPALAKSKKDIPNARKGYLALNSAAMRLMSKDGILITCSCSHHISRSLFLDMLHEAGRRVKRTVTILEARGAGIDHPLLAAMPETEYLKVFFLNVH